MAPSVAQPVMCPVLVGRGPALEVLHRFLEEVSGGRGHTVLVSGEAGIGKSRLVREVWNHAERQGWQSLQGNCFELDRSLPYAPLIDMLPAISGARSSWPATNEPARGAPEFVQLLLEPGALRPDGAAAQSLDPEREKRRLFQALAYSIARYAEPHPLLFMVEDLHWSDDSSLEFLLYLARQIGPQRILMVLTYRSDEVHSQLQHFLAELDRQRLAAELRLAPLSVAEVDAMLRSVFQLQRPVDVEFLQALYSLTEGNPFFIEEVLKSLVKAGEISDAGVVGNDWPSDALRIPRSVQDAVQRRAERLSRAAQRTLAVAAVAGRRFDFAVLQHLLRCDEHELLQLMKELIRAQLVVEESAERFAFRHALTRQAVYARLLRRERKLLHREIAATIERVYADSLDGRLADLAYHFCEAGVWSKALEYAQRAGERSRALYAPRIALEQFTRALQAARQLSIAPSPALYRGRGWAYESLGDFDRARADHEAALQAARATGDRRAEWRALVDLGMLWAARNYAQTGPHYQRALDLARAMGDPSTLAQSLNRLANWHVNVEEPHEGLRYHREALAVFQQLRDRRGIAETLDFLGMASYLSGDLVQGTAYYEQAIPLFRELDDRHLLVSILATLAMRGGTYQTNVVLPAASTLAESARSAEMALAISRAIGWRSDEAYAVLHLGFCLGSLGEYGRALDAARLGVAIAEEIGHRPWLAKAHCLLGMIHFDVLDLPTARMHLERALALAAEAGSLIWIRFATAFLASVLIAQKEHESAEAVLQAVPGPDPRSQTLALRLCWCARAELALARGEAGQALQIVDDLIASTPGTSDRRPILRLARLRAEALARLNRRDEAVSLLQAARADASARGATPLLWRMHLSLGRLYWSLGCRKEAGE